VLLHLCAGGVHTSEKGVYPAEDKNVGRGSSDKEKPPSHAAVPSRDAVFPERANDVFNYMVRRDVPRTEMTYTALARVEAAAGKPRQSFDVALRSVSERLRPKLRTFAPALHAFCAVGDLSGANEVEDAIARHDIELGENEVRRARRRARGEGRLGRGRRDAATRRRDVSRFRRRARGTRARACSRRNRVGFCATRWR
jgi:proteinaceous RNase P